MTVLFKNFIIQFVVKKSRNYIFSKEIDATSLILNAASNLEEEKAIDKSESGLELFIDQVLDKLEIKIDIVKSDLTRVPLTGAFIMVCNRPFGGMETLAILKSLLSIRKDIKIIGSFNINTLEPLKYAFFQTDFFQTGKYDTEGLKGVSKHLMDGKALIVFPAGNETEKYSFDWQKVDKKWNTVALKLIKYAKVPVIPASFSGLDNIGFYLTGPLNTLLQKTLLRLDSKNNEGKTIKIRIGNAISVTEQAEFSEVSRYGRYIRSKVYTLESQAEVKKYFTPLFHYPQKVEEIIAPIDQSAILNEINNLPSSCLLFKHTNYTVYCAPHSYIPSIVMELGRLREQTFRDVGEGTNKKIDIDEYDLYYRHLFIWDNTKQCIVGSYRIGMGSEIMQKYGVKGFYVRSLFKLNKKMNPMLHEALELGRSFIVKDYQRNPVTLLLLWKGILYFLLQNESYRYLFGPVSISNNFSNISKALITGFFIKNHFDSEKAKWVKPRKMFKVNFSKVDTEIIHDKMPDMNSLDKIIREIEPDNNRVPVLLKKYLQLGGKIVCFNIDPKFNDALDGLMILDLYTIPNEQLKLLSKELDIDVVGKRMNKK